MSKRREGEVGVVGELGRELFGNDEGLGEREVVMKEGETATRTLRRRRGIREAAVL